MIWVERNAKKTSARSTNHVDSYYSRENPTSWPITGTQSLSALHPTHHGLIFIVQTYPNYVSDWGTGRALLRLSVSVSAAADSLAEPRSDSTSAQEQLHRTGRCSYQKGSIHPGHHSNHPWPLGNYPNCTVVYQTIYANHMGSTEQYLENSYKGTMPRVPRFDLWITPNSDLSISSWILKWVESEYGVIKVSAIFQLFEFFLWVLGEKENCAATGMSKCHPKRWSTTTTDVLNAFLNAALIDKLSFFERLDKSVDAFQSQWFSQCNISSIALMQFDAFTQSRRRVLMLSHIILHKEIPTSALWSAKYNRVKQKHLASEKGFKRVKSIMLNISCYPSFHVIPHLQALHRFLWHFSAWEHDISPPKLVVAIMIYAFVFGKIGKHTGTYRNLIWFYFRRRDKS